MSRPSLLPEESDEASTRTRPHRRNRVVWLMVLILLVTLAGGAATVYYRPEAFDLARVGNLTGTAGRYNATQGALASTGTALAAAQSTLQADSTSAAESLAASETAIVRMNAHRATQAALDFQSTSAAFSQQATRVELDYQGTRAALNRDATAAALGFTAQETPAQLDDMLTPTAVQDAPFIDERRLQGMSTAPWEVSGGADWRVEDDVLIAQRDGAWLLSQEAEPGAYTLDLTLQLPGDAPGFVIISAPTSAGTDGLALRLNASPDGMTQATLLRYPPSALDSAVGLASTASQTLQSTVFQPSVAVGLSLRLQVNAGSVTVLVDDSPVMQAQTRVPPGAVGLQIPSTGRVRRIDLAP